MAEGFNINTFISGGNFKVGQNTAHHKADGGAQHVGHSGPHKVLHMENRGQLHGGALRHVIHDI